MLQLIDIQKKQFSDKHGAERELLAFLQEHEDRTIRKVELQPKPESLNSLNGFVTYDSGDRYFFKTHTEENEKVSEYYNAEELARAGYPVITSKQITQKVGKQIVLYQVINHPTLFDLVKQFEDQEISGITTSDTRASETRVYDTRVSESSNSNLSNQSGGPGTTAAKLLTAQIELDKLVASIYGNTAKYSDQETNAKAPIHQLFSHRLADDGRLGIFYKNKTIKVAGDDLSFAKLASMKWSINDVEYEQTLAQIIERAKLDLQPQAGITVAGHGDAHNGNIFVDLAQSKFYMFDPAFAGQHNPLLDLTKPLFHNIFARWMYFPEQVQQEFQIEVSIQDTQIKIEHDFLPTKLRREHLDSRIINVLRPTIFTLREHKQLPDNWRQFLRSALFCCPFLTVNLFADYKPNGTLSERYQLPIKWLGLAISMELGATAHKRSNSLTEIVDEIFAL